MKMTAKFSILMGFLIVGTQSSFLENFERMKKAGHEFSKFTPNPTSTKFAGKAKPSNVRKGSLPKQAAQPPAASPPDTSSKQPPKPARAVRAVGRYTGNNTSLASAMRKHQKLYNIKTYGLKPPGNRQPPKKRADKRKKKSAGPIFRFRSVSTDTTNMGPGEQKAKMLTGLIIPIGATVVVTLWQHNKEYEVKYGDKLFRVPKKIVKIMWEVGDIAYYGVEKDYKVRLEQYSQDPENSTYWHTIFTDDIAPYMQEKAKIQEMYLKLTPSYA